jgi:hypothetical protein
MGVPGGKSTAVRDPGASRGNGEGKHCLTLQNSSVKVSRIFRLPAHASADAC